MSKLVNEQPLEEVSEETGSSETAVDLNFLNEKEERKVKRIDSKTLTLNGDKYQVLEDYREALDIDILEERYSDFLKKYDYIVGDIAHSKLRLRGFFEDRNKKVPIDMRISHLEDYLYEYCNFGCQYFVLKRLEPKKRKQNKPKRKRERRSNTPNKKQSKKQKNLEKFEEAKKRNETHKSRSRKKGKSSSFVKKERANQPSSKQKPAVKEGQSGKNVQTVKDKKGKTKFHIRRTNNDQKG